MESTTEIAGKLKHLLGIVNDGKEGYKNAADNADSAELKALFTTYSIQRSEFEMELKTLIRQFGGDPDNETGGPLGALHRVWIDIKTAILPNDNHAVLDACITGEKAAVKAYDEVLAETSLSSDLREHLLRQRNDIEECLGNVTRLETQYTAS
jgi:uncharacterized protein (TIGR02284 family)